MVRCLSSDFLHTVRKELGLITGYVPPALRNKIWANFQLYGGPEGCPLKNSQRNESNLSVMVIQKVFELQEMMLIVDSTGMILPLTDPSLDLTSLLTPLLQPLLSSLASSQH